MSGHSHWATIKHKKGAVDAKRGKMWSKLSRAIIIAARNGGGDPNMNLKLRYAIDKARAVSMPKDNIERAIKRGTGDMVPEMGVRILRLMDALDDHDDVQHVYTDMNMTDAIMAEASKE